jgi:hypothetical protein
LTNECWAGASAVKLCHDGAAAGMLNGTSIYCSGGSGVETGCGMGNMPTT